MVMLGGTMRPARQMPAGLINEERRVCAGRDLGGDFRQVQVHRFGVASGHDERRAFAVPGADCAEDIGAGGSLIFGSARTRAALGPTPGDLVLLPDARFVGEPDFYCGRIDGLFARDLVQTGWKVFLYSSMAPSAWA